MIFDEFMKHYEYLREHYKSSVLSNSLAKILFRQYKHLTSDEFGLMCEKAISNYRRTPMEQDWIKIADMVGLNKPQRRYGTGSTAYAPSVANTMLDGLESRNTTADPSFVRQCVNDLRDYNTGRMSKKDFFKRRDEADKVAREIMKAKKIKPRHRNHDDTLQIDTLVACDYCGKHFRYRGFSSVLLDSATPRFCRACATAKLKPETVDKLARAPVQNT